MEVCVEVCACVRACGGVCGGLCGGVCVEVCVKVLVVVVCMYQREVKATTVSFQVSGSVGRRVYVYMCVSGVQVCAH